ncbi:MAG: PIN domain-containing protein [Thermoguttaceae bacterium]|jgi:predicted nucleic acid-binding protein
MKPLFADTSFYVALLNPRDIMHVKALQVGDYFHRPVLLTDFVLLELGNVLSSVGQRSLFTKLTDRLRSDPNIRIVAASRDLLDKGLGLFSRREDKEWSLTDCTSFVIMQEEELKEALTTDHHFEQAGFTVLLR